MKTRILLLIMFIPVFMVYSQRQENFYETDTTPVKIETDSILSGKINFYRLEYDVDFILTLKDSLIYSITVKEREEDNPIEASFIIKDIRKDTLNSMFFDSKIIRKLIEINLSGEFSPEGGRIDINIYIKGEWENQIIFIAKNKEGQFTVYYDEVHEDNEFIDLKIELYVKWFKFKTDGYQIKTKSDTLTFGNI